MKNLSIAIILLAIIFLSLAPLKSVLAEHLLIIEVQIAGDISNNDFIRIYNPANNDLDVSGYKLRKRTSTGRESSIRVFPKGSLIKSKGYFLWANSRENFHLTIRADAWSTTILSKNNSIALLSPENVILDALAWGESQNPFVKDLPFPENPDDNQQLKRKRTNEDYQNTNNNRQDFYLHPFSEKPSSKTETLPVKDPQPKPKLDPRLEIQLESRSEFPIYPSGIIINEILPNTPLGVKDEEGEYIEIFNQNNFKVNISDWKIKDTTGRTTTYAFPKGTKIKPLGFLTFFRPVTKITLNNDGDGLNLIQPDGKIISSASHEKAPRGQSYNRTTSGWAWSATLTPGSINIILTQERKEIGEETKDTSVEVKPPQVIDINAASAKELQKIIGIGPILAQRIIDARPFYSLDELTKVSGIGPKTLEDIKKQRLAWVDPKLEPPKIEKTESSETQMATVAAPFNQGSLGGKITGSLSILLIALTIATFSGIIILTLKKKLKPITVK